MSRLGWIGVGLDGTLARYDEWVNIASIGEPIPAMGYDEWVNIASIGEPIPAMVQRVQNWLAQGVTVKIFTSRVGFQSDQEFVATQTRAIQDWCEKHIGERLEVTCMKDFAMLELWDDRCVQVETNTGVPEARVPSI